MRHFSLGMLTIRCSAPSLRHLTFSDLNIRHWWFNVSISITQYFLTRRDFILHLQMIEDTVHLSFDLNQSNCARR